MQLTPQTVEALFVSLLYRAKTDTVPDDAVIVNGLTGDFGLHPGRLAEAKDDIAKLLRELPASVLAEGAVGFQELCYDRRGRQWGEHRDMELLCVLAIGAGLASWALPRCVWPVVPGGLPPIAFDLSA